MTFADGCRLEYDQATHVLSVTLPGSGRLQLCGLEQQKWRSQLSSSKSSRAFRTTIRRTLISLAYSSVVRRERQ